MTQTHHSPLPRRLSHHSFQSFIPHPSLHSTLVPSSIFLFLIFLLLHSSSFILSPLLHSLFFLHSSSSLFLLSCFSPSYRSSFFHQSSSFPLLDSFLHASSFPAPHSWSVLLPPFLSLSLPLLRPHAPRHHHALKTFKLSWEFSFQNLQTWRHPPRESETSLGCFSVCLTPLPMACQGLLSLPRQGR